MNRVPAALVAIVLACGLLRAQSFPPGYVDPLPLLAAASKEIGEANLRCITFSGTGYNGAVGQTAEYAVNIDWPRIDALVELHAHHQLGNRHEQGDVRSQARTQSRVLEVRPRLAGRHAASRNSLAKPTSSTARLRGTSTAKAASR